MAKTPEEIAVEEKFQKAVEEYVAANNGQGLVIDWILVVAEHMVDEDGSSTGLSTYVSREQSVYRSSGLINYAMQKINNAIARPFHG